MINISVIKYITGFNQYIIIFSGTGHSIQLPLSYNSIGRGFPQKLHSFSGFILNFFPKQVMSNSVLCFKFNSSRIFFGIVSFPFLSSLITISSFSIVLYNKTKSAATEAPRRKTQTPIAATQNLTQRANLIDNKWSLRFYQALLLSTRLHENKTL